MVQLHQRALLDPRHIGAGDAELAGNFPLCALVSAAVQAESPSDDLLLAFVENVQVSVYFTFLDFQLHFIDHFVRLGSENILQRNFIALFIRADRIGQRNIFARLFERPQMHQDLVLDTTSRECGELRAFAGLKALNGLDEADRADRNQILEIFAGIVELLEVVNTIRCHSHVEETVAVSNRQGHLRP